MQRVFTRWLLGAVLALAAGELPAGADVVTGAGWRVLFNLPDQNSSSPSPGEFEIRDALLARINQLQTTDQAWLATYTFSGDTTNNGAAGPIMLAISNALNRGAQIAFVIDSGISVTSLWQGISLQMLTNRAVNPLVVAQDNSASGIMHNKLGIFRIGTNYYSLVTSMNFTGGASSDQWNMAIEIEGRELFNAYTNEMAEFLAGRFHGDATKSHAHSKSTFPVSGTWGTNYVRFAPYASSATTGDNAQADIVRLISNATTEIVFALNRITRPLIRDALKNAANRGVVITGVIPQSDLAVSTLNSYPIYTNLIDATSYAGSNRVNFLLPFDRGTGSVYDTSTDTDLVHAKYMIIDPWTEKAVVIHGSANWTDSALASTSANDENVLFLFNKDIARAFYTQFRRMTATVAGRDQYWHVAMRSAADPEIAYWRTSTNDLVLEQSSLAGPLSWSVLSTNGPVGRVTMPAAGSGQLFRAFH